MTHVYLEQENGVFKVICNGHATGSPETCASISALIQTGSAWLRFRGKTPIEEKMEPGDAKLVFAGEDCDILFEILSIGLLSLQKTSPEYIQVTLRAEDYE